MMLFFFKRLRMFSEVFKVLESRATLNSSAKIDSYINYNTVDTSCGDSKCGNNGVSCHAIYEPEIPVIKCRSQMDLSS